MQLIANSFIYGIIILIVAIGANFIAKLFRWLTWYDFINKLPEVGPKQAIQDLSVSSALFLFIVYPLILGLSVIIAQKIVEYLSR